MTDTELKRCPFCDGEAHLADSIDTSRMSGIFYYGICGKCQGKNGPYLIKEKAIEAWNKRVEDAPKIGLSEEYFNSYREDLS